MPEFAIFFRTGPRPLSDDELARRAAAVRAWVNDANQRGVLDHPHLLDDAGVVVASDRSAAPIVREGALATVLIVRAADLDAAVAVARSHPGLDFGSSAEVRPLKPPVLVPPR
jgi:hypothetical protein